MACVCGGSAAEAWGVAEASGSRPATVPAGLYCVFMRPSLPVTQHHQKYDRLQNDCPVRAALDVIRGRWKPSILFELKSGPKRYSEIQAAIPEVSAQALTVQLRQLEADGVVSRRVHADSSVRVEYAMTDFGMSLSDVMDQLEAWGVVYLERRRETNG